MRFYQQLEVSRDVKGYFSLAFTDHKKSNGTVVKFDKNLPKWTTTEQLVAALKENHDNPNNEYIEPVTAEFTTYVYIYKDPTTC